ncbi:Pre-mRNA-splicing ATP-dependent RNA helicase PRP28 [Cyphellophora attinorum]|uniref:Pre-mRNA-splicing ATP-dependent RNA helicase PRP28 n=1 Tax=Cyphellophora attinorum TaxID=1664694 RepID=A0A0N0NLT3_9EURO|nr:Pre-mRNA-splicing ATP-dependent RNA helicase PRP28 [Phialophora attinorum]KPI39548.1 Pre-mRNA-splicing ATP-dependent RNA helicase PRP28 [Phialophora attinorum]
MGDAPPPPPATNGVKKQGWGAPPSKKTPLNVEELVKAKRAADLAASKPKFISKAERERIALEKRAKEVAAASTAVKTNGYGDAPTEKDLKHTNGNKDIRNGHGYSNGYSNGHDALPKGPRADRDREHIPSGPAAMRKHGRPSDLSPPAPPKPIAFGAGDSKKKASDAESFEKEQEELRRRRYLGPEHNISTFSASKKRKRTTDKKFNFGWDEDEDTSAPNDTWLDSKMQTSFFGRGRLGGFDDTVAQENAKAYAAALEARDKETGAARAKEFLEQERRRREHSHRMAIDVHWSKKDLNQMRERDWRIFKEDFNIATKGGAIPNPMRNWQESNLPSRLLNIIDEIGYKDPSAIQRAAIPIAMQNRDLIGVAVTGSGKTAAFLLPLLVYISELPRLDESEWRRSNGPYAIVLAPTRELAQQIELEARKFCGPLGFNVVSIVGGHSIEEQAYNLRNGCEIIIATPGRLVDCIDRRIIVLEQCCYVIMDEADRMIDLGFEEPVNRILSALPVGNEKPDTDAAENARAMSAHLGDRERYWQTMMYTATMPAAVERIARKYLRRPAIVTIGNVGEAVDTVEQRVEFVSGEDKRKHRLKDILRGFPAPIIVFVNIKRNCDAVARDVKQMGYNAVTLHGSKTQEQREAALLSLREGRSDVLVATDLAGRGIDVPDVSLVVNFNMATNIESYTHRIGRTGRAGKTGVAITFLGPEDNDVLYDLKMMLGKSERSRVPEELRRHEAAQRKGAGRGAGKGGAGEKAIEN